MSSSSEQNRARFINYRVNSLVTSFFRREEVRLGGIKNIDDKIDEAASLVFWHIAHNKDSSYPLYFLDNFDLMQIMDRLPYWRDLILEEYDHHCKHFK